MALSQNQPYPVTGVILGGTYPRLEIRELYKKPEQFTLFVLGWEAIRRPDYRPIAAQFVQQAGIHGAPNQQWPGDPNGPSKPVATWGGYCNHESVLFPTWHRPSILLLEQSISEAAHKVAGEFARQYPNEANSWLEAAKELRFPFWDWLDPSTGKEGLPPILYDEYLHLHMPGGLTVKRENILAFYRFGKTRPDGFQNRKQENSAGVEGWAYYEDWERTYRWPESTRIDPKEDYKALNDRLTGNTTTSIEGSWKELRAKVSNLFFYPRGIPEELHANVWDEFSNTSFQSGKLVNGKPTSPYAWGCGSLEQPHNSLHLVLGGLGHMMDNDYASFDPVFFLHHCNIDRILAFWEYVYPDYWIGNDGYLNPDGKTRGKFTQVDGTFASSAQEPLTEVSELAPFRKTDEHYWTSKDTRSLKSNAFPKYYTYPGLDGVFIDDSAPAEQRTLHRAILQKYFGLDIVQIRNKARTLKQQLFSDINSLPDNLEAIYNYRHFIIEAELVGHAFDGSYQLDVFYATKAGEDLHVGSVAVLGRGDASNCEACKARREAGSRVYGIIPVPHEIIVKSVEEHDLDEETVDNAVLVRTVKDGFHAQLSRPGGILLSHNSHRYSGTGSALSDELTPKLRFRSANVAAPKAPRLEGHRTDVPQDASPEEPYEFYDWQDHESLLSTNWIAATA
ncbi:hypothetical protein BOTBODRAFT_174471 [Botryobasidium botryosum FD-172 SS1]|uniref:tyrosinase n=1 Tax=Botryobasidium botryosum (strain FD-172 SS1) TaxID=930990 RepID=A0A067MJR9_BOTB1|nr:hypothetical protein BOTBODRAFT_174471 [Botryobasidium botryosum FD-172 SS1]